MCTYLTTTSYRHGRLQNQSKFIKNFYRQSPGTCSKCPADKLRRNIKEVCLAYFYLASYDTQGNKITLVRVFKSKDEGAICGVVFGGGNGGGGWVGGRNLHLINDQVQFFFSFCFMRGKKGERDREIGGINRYFFLFNVELESCNL